MSKKLDYEALAALLSIGIMPLGDKSTSYSLNSSSRQRDSEGLSKRIKGLYDDVDDKIVSFPSETEEHSPVQIPQNGSEIIENLPHHLDRREILFFPEQDEGSMVDRLYHTLDLERDENKIFPKREGLESLLEGYLAPPDSDSLSQIKRKEYGESRIKSLEYIVSESEKITPINSLKKEILTEYSLKEEVNQSEISAPQYTTSMYSGILETLLSQGYSPKIKNISPEYEVVRPKTPEPAEVEVTRQGLPAEYGQIAAMLAEKHQGIQYLGTLHLEDQSSHNVDILTFEYEEDGEKKQMHVVVKDANEVEEKIPQFLNDLGIRTHSVFDIRTRLHMQHVGERSLRDIVKQASENDVRRLSARALDTIAQIHVLATAHLPELKRDYGIELSSIDYTQEFRRRFLEPVSDHSVIISPQMDKLMQAYAAFTKAFAPRSFIHGDYHDMNCRVEGDICYPIDWEMAAIGREFDDVSRLVNSIMRDRPDMDASEFTAEMLRGYVEKHNEHAEQEKTPLMLSNERLASTFRYSLINDEIYKIGEYVLFGEAHQAVKEEKMQKSVACLERAFKMLDGSIELTDKQGDYYGWETLSNLRIALVDYVKTSPIEALREVAERYKIPGYVKEPLILVPA